MILGAASESKPWIACMLTAKSEANPEAKSDREQDKNLLILSCRHKNSCVILIQDDERGKEQKSGHNRPTKAKIYIDIQCKPLQTTGLLAAKLAEASVPIRKSRKPLVHRRAKRVPQPCSAKGISTLSQTSKL
jgi:hypothetical protein